MNKSPKDYEDYEDINNGDYTLGRLLLFVIIFFTVTAIAIWDFL